MPTTNSETPRVRKVRFTTRLPLDLYDLLDSVRLFTGLSVNALIIEALRHRRPEYRRVLTEAAEQTGPAFVPVKLSSDGA